MRSETLNSKDGTATLIVHTDDEAEYEAVKAFFDDLQRQIEQRSRCEEQGLLIDNGYNHKIPRVMEIKEKK